MTQVQAVTEYRTLARAQRAAYVAWQNASGDDYAQAVEAYKIACKELDAFIAKAKA